MSICTTSHSRSVEASSAQLCEPYISQIRCCVVDGYCFCVVDRHFSSFCRIVVCTVCKSQAYFTVLSPRLSVTHSVCLHFCFLASRPGKGGIQFPSISFCLQVAELSVYRKSKVWIDACNSSCLVLQLQSTEVSRTVTSSFSMKLEHQCLC
jgi:hypothetical protein